MIVTLFDILESAEDDPTGSSLPAQIKRCVVAVAKKRGRGGSRISPGSAYKICRASQTRNGYYKAGSEKGPSTNIKQTQKGARRNLQKSMKPDTDKKNKEFRKVWPKAIKELPDDWKENRRG